jgi:hypothetical protein
MAALLAAQHAKELTMAFKKLSLATMTVPYALGVYDTVLNLAQSDKVTLSTQLAIGDFTYATLSEAGVEEVIKIGPVDYLGNVPILARGTEPKAFTNPCLSFGWTDEAIAEMYPEHHLGFTDGCGHKAGCPCDTMPKTMTVGKAYSVILPYQGAPDAVTVIASIPGITATYTPSAVFFEGSPTIVGTYSVFIQLTKGTRSIQAVCPVEIVAAEVVEEC